MQINIENSSSDIAVFILWDLIFDDVLFGDLLNCEYTAQIDKRNKDYMRCDIIVDLSIGVLLFCIM